MERSTPGSGYRGHDARLAELEAEADRLTADEQTLRRPGDGRRDARGHARHTVSAAVREPAARGASFRRGLRRRAGGDSSRRSSSWTRRGPTSLGMADGMGAMLHAQAAIVLVEISRLDVPRRAELLARARGHFDQLPAADARSGAGRG